jgi:hypothetical protein
MDVAAWLSELGLEQYAPVFVPTHSCKAHNPRVQACDRQVNEVIVRVIACTTKRVFDVLRMTMPGKDKITFTLGEFENSRGIILSGEESPLHLVYHSQASENALQLVAVVDLRAEFAGARVGGLGLSGAVAFCCHVNLTECVLEILELNINPS